MICVRNTKENMQNQNRTTYLHSWKMDPRRPKTFYFPHEDVLEKKWGWEWLREWSKWQNHIDGPFCRRKPLAERLYMYWEKRFFLETECCLLPEWLAISICMERVFRGWLLSESAFSLTSVYVWKQKVVFGGWLLCEWLAINIVSMFVWRQKRF